MGNNPVIGVDPDGEFVHLLIGAAIGGVVNLGVKAFQGKIGGWKDGFAAFGIGAAAGVVTAATGGAASGALGLSMTSIGGGAVAGASGAVLGSPLQGLGNAAYFGDAYSGKQFLTDIVAGGVLGGVAGGTAGWIKNMKAAKVGGPLHNMITGRVVGNGRTPWSLNNSSKWNISFDDIQADFPEYVHPNGNVTKGGNHTISGNTGAATGNSSVLLNTSRQLQAKFYHAGDFGILGNYNKINAGKFSSAINQHINSTGVQTINGTYRGQSVIHYLNPNTGLNVISNPTGQFISGWKLNPVQLQNVLKYGGL